ncbi:hypothetical protein [Hymenobacter weizhouensis]|uniref:hypothetical protein n=1 Tax=Hymenobacter sp. YIM 151500-1 TaxID=2987689 RepID=UPI0022262C93|nr:hypothetical protein [Hymenobacter sp. YIM 151500-1]UYZ63160.1 hypothetical protein OIS53_19470 [Hymenobacter sp. YIM 151500-1]
MSNIIMSQEPYVWPDIEGTTRGQAVEPLYNKVPHAAKGDPRLYELLALTDALRVGRAREKKIAQQKIKEYFDE